MGAVTLTWKPNPASQQVDYYQIQLFQRYKGNWLPNPYRDFTVSSSACGFSLNVEARWIVPFIVHLQPHKFFTGFVLPEGKFPL